DPARFTTFRTRFPPKTRCVGNVCLWQFIRAKDFFAVKICYRHFRSRGEKELIIFQSVHIGFKFWELRCSDHAFAPHQKRRAHFFVTMLARVQIEHELDQSSLQPRAGAGKTDETTPTQL